MSEALFVNGSLLLGVALLAIGYASIARQYPTAALTLWLVSLCAVPYWIGERFGVFWPLACLFGLMTVVALLSTKVVKFQSVDLLPIAIAASAGVAVAAFQADPGLWTVMLTHWLVGYFVARATVPRIGERTLCSVVSLTLSATALAAIVESVIGVHFFSDLGANGSQGYQIWGAVQLRGGDPRIEGAFGHSIALGGAFALAVPFLWSSRFTFLPKLALTAVLAGAAVLTQSRGALIAVGVSLLVVLFTSRTMKDSHRVMGLLATLAAGIVGMREYSAIVERGGSETVNSGLYRLDLLSLVPTMQPFGPATSTRYTSNGTVQYGSFPSIDNAFMQVGLSYGYIVMALLVAGMIAVVARVLTGRGNVAEAALVGQLPLLMTAPFLTQWQILLWFVAGAAVSLATVARATSDREPIGTGRLRGDRYLAPTST